MRFTVLNSLLLCIHHNGMSQVNVKLKFTLEKGWVVNITPRPLYPRKRTQIHIEQEVGWAPVPLWAIWRREKYLNPTVIRTADRPARTAFAISTPSASLLTVFTLHSVILMLFAAYSLGNRNYTDFNAWHSNLFLNFASDLKLRTVVWLQQACITFSCGCCAEFS